MEKMTIHRALAELKLIDSRIQKAINSIEPTGIMQKDKNVNNFFKKEDFEKDAKSKYQSVSDLIDRKNKIKSAIVKANGVTEVEVAGYKMTIADAINYKSVIEFKKQLIDTLKQKHARVKGDYQIKNEEISRVALNNAQIMLGKQGDERVKPTDKDVEQIMKPFVERNEFHLVDPLEVDKLTEQLEKEVLDFETEVDAVLSEINAVTLIEI